MLLFLALWALVPCLVLVTLYFLSSVGGKSGGNKKNDGVKVSPPGATRACSGSVSFKKARLSGLAKTQALLVVFWADGVSPAAGPIPDPETWASGPTSQQDQGRKLGRKRGRGRVESWWETQTAWGWNGHKERGGQKVSGVLWGGRTGKQRVQGRDRGVTSLFPSVGWQEWIPDPIHPSPRGWTAIPLHFGVQRCSLPVKTCLFNAKHPRLPQPRPALCPPSQS